MMSCNEKQCPKRRESISIDGKQFKQLQISYDTQKRKKKSKLKERDKETENG